MIYLYLIGFIAALFLSVVLTPFIKQFSGWIGAVDVPSDRKVHTSVMPRLGGLAIFLAYTGAFFIVIPALDSIDSNVAWGLLIGGAIIVLTGVLDDRFQLSPIFKLLGITGAALVVVVGFGVKVDLVNVPFGGHMVDLAWLGVPLTVFWIVGVTNAINLIDGLDGLAAGVSAIATTTMLVLAVMMGNLTVILLCALLLGSILGFLFFNFYPAKIFMGDTGALFLGFSLATLSILGFKQATLVSFIVPLLMIGVPLSDTLFAIVRRLIHRKPIFTADKGHLHHRLLQLGFSHRQTVLIIYGVSSLFGLGAIVLSQATLWVGIVVMAALLLVLGVGADMIGVINNRKPLLRFLRRKVRARDGSAG